MPCPFVGWGIYYWLELKKKLLKPTHQGQKLFWEVIWNLESHHYWSTSIKLSTGIGRNCSEIYKWLILDLKTKRQDLFIFFWARFLICGLILNSSQLCLEAGVLQKIKLTELCISILSGFQRCCLWKLQFLHYTPRLFSCSKEGKWFVGCA